VERWYALMVTSALDSGGGGAALASGNTGSGSQEPPFLHSLTPHDRAALERHLACRRAQIEEESRAEVARRLQNLPLLPLPGTAKEQVTLLVGQVAHGGSRASGIQAGGGGGGALALLT